MSFFKSLPDGAGPRTIFTAYPEIYKAWSEVSQAIMNGPSDLTPGERELILTYVVGAAGCEFIFVAHKEVAREWGIPEGLVERLVEDFDSADVEPRMKTLLGFVGKLMVTPTEVTQEDADAVFARGWSEKAVHDAIAVTARASFMQKLVHGYGFVPLDKDEAIKRAKGRVEKGYVGIFPEFDK